MYIKMAIHTQICSNENQSRGRATVAPHSLYKCVSRLPALQT